MLFNLFKKKPQEKPVEVAPKKQLVKVLKFKPEAQFEVGKTHILYILQDGRSFRRTIYGEISQFWRKEEQNVFVNGYNDAVIGDIKILSSLTKAQNMILQHSLGEEILGDDELNPTISYTGKVMETEIVSSELYQKSFKEAYLEEAELDL